MSPDHEIVGEVQVVPQIGTRPSKLVNENLEMGGQKVVGIPRVRVDKGSNFVKVHLVR